MRSFRDYFPKGLTRVVAVIQVVFFVQLKYPAGGSGGAPLDVAAPFNTLSEPTGDLSQRSRDIPRIADTDRLALGRNTLANDFQSPSNHFGRQIDLVDPFLYRGAETHFVR